MANKGRPRKAGARYKCGAVKPEKDYGSLHLQLQRLAALSPLSASQVLSDLSQASPDGLTAKEAREIERHQVCVLAMLKEASSDPRASYQLGVLFARRVINSAQHYAGRRYQGIYTRGVCPPRQPSVLSNLVGGGTCGPIPTKIDVNERAAENRIEYLDTRTALEYYGRVVTSIVDAVTVFDFPPMPQQIDDLKSGLNALLEHFETSDKRR